MSSNVDGGRRRNPRLEQIEGAMQDDESQRAVYKPDPLEPAAAPARKPRLSAFLQRQHGGDDVPPHTTTVSTPSPPPPPPLPSAEAAVPDVKSVQGVESGRRRNPRLEQLEGVLHDEGVVVGDAPQFELGEEQEGVGADE